MCKECVKTVKEHQFILDVIDNHRESFMALLDQILIDTKQELVDHPGDPKEPPERNQNLCRILVANYVSAFLVGDCDPPEGYTNAVQYFYAKGLDLGKSYLCVRQNSNH